jgi:hypothetical protein
VRWHFEQDGPARVLSAGSSLLVHGPRRSVDLLDPASGRSQARVDWPEHAGRLIDAAHYSGERSHVLVGRNGYLCGIGEEGNRRWERDLGGGEVCGAAFLGPLMVVGTSTGLVHGINPRSGEPLWHVRQAPDPMLRPFLHQGRLFTFRRDYTQGQTAVHALFPFTGRTARQTRLPGLLVGPPAFVGETIVLPLERGGRLFLAGLPAEGYPAELRWSVELTAAGVDGPTAPLLVTIDERPHVVVRTDRSEVSCIDVGTGALVWRRAASTEELLYRNLDLIRIRDAVLGAGPRVELFSVADGELLHTFSDLVDSPRAVRASGSLSIVIGEAGVQGPGIDHVMGIRLDHFLAVIQ